TIGRIQSDYFYPQLADRNTPQEWQEKGSPDILEIARRKTREILDGPDPGHLDRKIEQEIRQRFPIRLERENSG
ncbi:MAG: methyltransferase, partial [Gammaproteobacteria bacterium]|nr:methyltransferase [Gammaproteobacteria bacterium]